jgi:hypothetical protein
MNRCCTLELFVTFPEGIHCRRQDWESCNDSRNDQVAKSSRSQGQQHAPGSRIVQMMPMDGGVERQGQTRNQTTSASW